MKFINNSAHYYFILILFIVTSGCHRDRNTDIVTYSSPPDLITSPDFTVSVNGSPVWVERIGNPEFKPDYDLYGGKEMEYLNVANFSCAGPLNIKVTASEKINSFVIRPKSRNIQGKVKGQSLILKISGPEKLYVEINGLPHLAVFANPLEVDVPKKGDPDVVYFGPGTHNPGDIVLSSDQTVYISGGAIVYANIRGKDLHNVKISGRGSLQGNIRISNAANLNVEGIFVRNTKGWSNTLTNCRQSSYRNVKVFGYEGIYSVDGINPVSCRNFTIDDCFMRCRDDCVAIKSMNYDLNVDSIFVTNCVMVGWAFSDGVTLGFELNGGPVQNVLVKNCDILYARGGGRTGGHSGFSIVCDGPALVQNIRYENIRVEENVELKNLEFIITDGKLYGEDLPGRIKGVYLKDIQWDKAEKPLIISGFSEQNLVEDITFDNCRVGNKVLTSVSDDEFEINEFVKNIIFIH